MRTGFWWENLRASAQLEDPDVEDKIKVCLQEVGCGGMDWIDLARDMDRWRDLLNAVISLRVP